MDIVSKITQTIEPSLSSMGYDIVQIKFADGSRRKALIIMAERTDGVFMSFDDCSEITRMVSALLEVEDPITTAYDLEVCSPGLDRPLTKVVDFTRFAGQDAKLETMLPIDGRKRFRGIIKGAKDNTVTLTVEEKDVSMPFSGIRSAKLIPALVVGSGAQKKKGKK